MQSYKRDIARGNVKIGASASDQPLCRGLSMQLFDEDFNERAMPRSVWVKVLLGIAAIPLSFTRQPRGGTYTRDDGVLDVQTASGRVNGCVNSTTKTVRI